ncbi:MAG: redoxin domain-containing protein [Acidimicrobiaceae bacterium]|nr:redoxin domain-containing protein [Acidimicrobiaceae bacterium]
MRRSVGSGQDSSLAEVGAQAIHEGHRPATLIPGPFATGSRPAGTGAPSRGPVDGSGSFPAMLDVDSQAPDFEAPDQHGNPVRLADLRGSWVVLWWYPKASTAG